MTKLKDIAIVGASLAGFRMAEALRRSGYDGKLTLIGSESHFPPFDRPPLSKHFLIDGCDRESFRLTASVDLDAQISSGVRVEALLPDHHSLVTSQGDLVRFDGLGIATGSWPRGLRCPGAQLDGVVSVRTVEDAADLRARLATRGCRIVIIGAGFVGCEVAAACRALGGQVTLVDAADRVMSRAVGPLASLAMADLHREHGIDVRLDTGIEAIIGPSQVSGVELTSGEILPADLVIVGIGSAPETSWLDRSGLPVDDGVLCDSTLAVVGAPHIVAAGDVARWFHAGYGTHLRVEHWTNAVEQAEHAARTMLSGTAADPYIGVPYFWSDQLGRKLQFVGVVGPEEELVEGSFDAGRAVLEYRSEGKLVGALCVGWPARLLRYRARLATALEQGANIQLCRSGSQLY